MEDQKQPDVPGISGQTFRIKLESDWYISKDRLVDLLRQSMWGTQYLLDRMVKRYENQTPQ